MRIILPLLGMIMVAAHANAAEIKQAPANAFVVQGDLQELIDGSNRLKDALPETDPAAVWALKLPEELADKVQQSCASCWQIPPVPTPVCPQGLSGNKMVLFVAKPTELDDVFEEARRAGVPMADQPFTLQLLGSNITEKTKMERLSKAFCPECEEVPGTPEPVEGCQ